MTTKSSKDSKKSKGKRTRARYDYKSGQGMQTYVWGPPLWTTIHIISFNYPVQPTIDNKKQYAAWLWGLEHILPCRACRENFSANMKQAGYNAKAHNERGYDDRVMKSRDTFSRFCHRLHNVVNRMLGKRTHPGFDEVRDKYESFRATCVAPQKGGYEEGCDAGKKRHKLSCQMDFVPRL